MSPLRENGMGKTRKNRDEPDLDMTKREFLKLCGKGLGLLSLPFGWGVEDDAQIESGLGHSSSSQVVDEPDLPVDDQL